jgi:Trk K+ transport system NAD-binding subunit
MSRGAGALVGWLALAIAVLVLIFSVAVRAGGFAPNEYNGHRPGFVSQLFFSLLHALDPGEVGNEAINGTGVHWIFLLLMLGVTLGGLLIVSALIGVMATGLEEKFRELRKGRSLVLERGHILVLGWSESVFAILRELAIANESTSNSCVVILADKDKIEIEDAIRERVDTRKTRIVVRRGMPTDPDELAIVNPSAARTVIVTGSDHGDPDAEVVKTILALVHAQREEGPRPTVAVISDPENLEVARLAGTGATVFIDKRETVARLLVQASRQAGMSVIYTELLDFAGDEIYLREDVTLVGATYGEAIFAYEDATVIGIASGESVYLNPPLETPIASGDQVIAIAEDDSLLATATRFSGQISEDVIVDASPRAAGPQRILLLGWNSGAANLLNELDGHVPAGSRAILVSDYIEAHADLDDRCTDLRHLELRVHDGNTSRRRTLQTLAVADFDHIIVLSYSDHLDSERADAKTIMTLLHLRELLSGVEAKPSIVSEMIDERNRKLAQVTDVNDVIVSDRLISLLISQLAENPMLESVFRELFSASGCEIHLRPASDYVRGGTDVSFATIIAAASRRCETAIGFRTGALSRDSRAAYGVRVNPPKSQVFGIQHDDSVIVLGC